MTKFRKSDSAKKLIPFGSTDGHQSPACPACDDSPPIPQNKEREEEFLTLSSDYQLTAQTRIKLDRRQQSLLLDVLNYQAVHFGVTFGMYLFIEMLYSSLAGSKDHPVDVRDRNERRTTFVARIILMSLNDTWTHLEEKLPLDQDIRERLLKEDCLMSRRVYGSRLVTWRPEYLLSLKAVRLDVFLERQSNSTPYSSYCKGYGESHPSRHRQKTKPSFELDGEEAESVNHIGLTEIPLLIHLNVTEIHRKTHRK